MGWIQALQYMVCACIIFLCRYFGLFWWYSECEELITAICLVCTILIRDFKEITTGSLQEGRQYTHLSSGLWPISPPVLFQCCILHLSPGYSVHLRVFDAFLPMLAPSSDPMSLLNPAVTWESEEGASMVGDTGIQHFGKQWITKRLKQRGGRSHADGEVSIIPFLLWQQDIELS